MNTGQLTDLHKAKIEVASRLACTSIEKILAKKASIWGILITHEDFHSAIESSCKLSVALADDIIKACLEP